MKKLVLIVLMIPFVFMAFANDVEKDNKKVFQKVELLINQGKYQDALKELKGITNVGNDVGEMNFFMGMCYTYMDFHQDDVIKYLEEASKYFSVSANPNLRGIECRYYLAQAYHQKGRVEEALELYFLIRKNISGGQTEVIERIDREINYCKNTIELKKKPVDFKITNLGANVNTPFEEHSPVITADEEMMIFTSNREGGFNAFSKDNYLEDIYITRWNGEEWTDVENIGSVINTVGSDASISLTPDGNSLFIYRHNGTQGDIYISRLVNGVWSVPEKLSRPINSSSNETHASMSVDEKRLFFTSDRTGGIGGKDIYMVTRLPNGEWGKEQNLGSRINTSFDEESPFLHADGKTLYFCSMGHNSMGGFDVFKSVLDDKGEWSKPENIGYPINTQDDELFYQPSIDGQRVYFSANRPEGKGSLDLYLVEFPETDTRSMSIIKGQILLSEYSDKPIEMIVSDSEGNMTGEYRANKENGKFVLILPAGKDYSVDIKVSGYAGKTVEIKVPLRTEFGSTKSIIEMDKVTLSKVGQ